MRYRLQTVGYQITSLHLTAIVLRAFRAKLPDPDVVFTMCCHNFLHANRHAGNMRVHASWDVVQLGIWSNLVNAFLLDSMPRPRCGFRWAICIHDQTSNGVTSSLAYEAKHAIDATNCQRCCVTWQVMCAVYGTWAYSRFPERLQSP
uniref:Uncharacterized protein n=1 Tax=Arundo donax TaxID=35708 RepID=A0A0A9BWL5_ARUDO